jgi:hypothetical protein
MLLTSRQNFLLNLQLQISKTLNILPEMSYNWDESKLAIALKNTTSRTFKISTEVTR